MTIFFSVTPCYCLTVSLSQAQSPDVGSTPKPTDQQVIDEVLEPVVLGLDVLVFSLLSNQGHVYTGVEVSLIKHSIL